MPSPVRRSRAKLQKAMKAAESLGHPNRYPADLSDDERYDILVSEGCVGIRALDIALCYFPEDGNRLLPEGGDWVMTTMEVHVQGIDLPMFNAYWAVPYRDGIQGWKDRRYSATVITEQGEVRLWPYEYGIITAPPLEKAFSDGEVIFHPFGQLRMEDVSERIFYIMTRGIPAEEAFPMALGDVKGPIGWFEMAPQQEAVAA